MNYTYIVKCNDESLYTGWTTNLDKRLADHNAGKGAKYTKSRRPVELIYYETFPTKEEAMRREYAIKQLSRQEKLALIKQAEDGERCFVTKHGIPIYSYPNNNLHSFCISLYVKAGCLYETEEDNGITHFIEHIVFRNIDKLMNHTLYQTLDCHGLHFNACTYKEFVQFTISGSPKHFSLAADLITKVFHPILLTSDEIDTERQRIKAEIREYDDKSTLDYFSDKIVWEGTHLHQIITGQLRTINKIGKKKLAKAHQEMFSTNCSFFYLTGCVTEKEVQILSQFAESYKLSVSTQVRDNTAPVPKNFFHRPLEIYIKSSDTYYVRFSFDVDTSRYTNAELDLLYDMLFTNHTCVLYQELSEKRGLIYSHDSSFEQYNNIGVLYFSYEVQSCNLIRSIEILIEQFQRLKENIGDELTYTLPPYVDNAYAMLDNASDLNWNFAYENHILKNQYHSLEQRIQAYQKVTKERITQMIQEIFRQSNLTLTIKGKKEKIDDIAIKTILQSLM